MRTTRQYLFLFIPLMLLTWLFFKWAYPFADFFSDSYSYIQAAADRDPISYRPIGYSVFLRMVHVLSVSDTFLVTVQYLLVQTASLTLLMFLRRHANLSGRVQFLLAAFFLFDPLVYYISNYVSSDALFIALSLFWMTILLQMLRRSSWQWLVLQWVLLALIFYTRYIALFYPAVASLTFLWVRRDIVFKLTAIAGSILIVAGGARYTREITRERTGAPVFSAFSGWQMANNALHIYPWLPPDTGDMPSPACRQLAQYVNDYFKRTGPAMKDKPPVATTAYMWETNSPLYRYFEDYRRGFRADTATSGYFIAWNQVSPTYTEYGYHLMSRHPLAFARYYGWPSTKIFFLSPLDVFAVYNEGKKDVDGVAQKWFHYRSPRIIAASPTIQATLLAPFPWLFLLLNLGFVLVAILFLRDSRLRAGHPFFTASLKLVAAYLVANACFNIFASPSVFRYQVLPLILLFIFTVTALFFLPFLSTNDQSQRHE